MLEVEQFIKLNRDFRAWIEVQNARAAKLVWIAFRWNKLIPKDAIRIVNIDTSDESR